MTGWNMPPGCNPRDIPGWEDPPCAVCGQLDDCVCPECPVCGAQGDPLCYDGALHHGLVRSFAQVVLLAETERQREEEAAIINAYDAKLDREALWADATHEPGPEPEEFNP